MESAQWLWSRAGNDGQHRLRFAPYDLTHDGLIRFGESVNEIYSVLFDGLDLPDPTEFPPPVIAGASSELTAVHERTVAPGESVDILVTFEQASRAAVAVLVPDADVNATIGGTPLVPSAGPGGQWLNASLTQPSDQVLRVSNTGSSAANIHGLVSVLSDRHLRVESAVDWVPAGTPVGFTLTLSEAETGDAPIAELVDSDGASTTIALTPGPLGTWTGEAIMSAAGSNRIVASVSGARQRFAARSIDVGDAGTYVGSDFTERLDDVDGDGLADSLVLSPSVTAARAGSYKINASLTDATGVQVGQTGVRLSLAAGTQAVDLPFDGETIFDAGLEGPYRLVDVRLYDDASVTQDVEAYLGDTLVSDYRAFQHDLLTFDPATFASQGIDANGDGIFEELEFTGSVSVETPGTYAIAAGLYASEGPSIMVAGARVEFVAGANEFTLAFDGPAIAAAGRAGPYRVRGLSVDGLATPDAGDITNAHSTAAYTIDQFRPPVPDPTSRASSPATTVDPWISITTSPSVPSSSGSVELWHRFRAEGSSTFSAWTIIATDPYGDFWTTLGHGLGTYEFYSIAVDETSGRREPAPGVADTSTELVAGLGSSVSPLPYYATTRDLAIPFVANYPSGAGSVELWQRYRPPCNCDFGDWALVTTATASPISLTVPADGSYLFHTIALDGGTGAREAAPLDSYGYVGADVHLEVDTVPPQTSASAVAALSEVSPITVRFTDSGAEVVELWSRHRATSDLPWSSWAHWQTVSRFDDFVFEFPSGAGYYELATAGIDWAGNRETLPATGDASTRYAPELGSSVGALPALVTETGISVPYTAGFDSGSGSVEIWQRFHPDGAAGFGEWTSVGTFDRPPAFLSLASGDGRYELYSVAVDSDGTREDPPALADATTRLDTTAPTSTVRSLPAVTTTSPLTLHCDASDAGSGVSHVTLFSRWVADPSDRRGPWQTGPSCLPQGAEGTASFDFPYGEGYWEFASAATDAAGHQEPFDGDPHTATWYEPLPVSSVNAPFPSPIRQTSISPTVTSTTDYELWQRSRAAGSADFGPWALVGVGEPGFQPVATVLNDGDGRYEFYSIAFSVSGQREEPPAVADAFTILDTTPPVSAAGPVVAQASSDQIEIPYAVDDGHGSGVQTLLIRSRHRPPRHPCGAPGSSSRQTTDQARASG